MKHMNKRFVQAIQNARGNMVKAQAHVDALTVSDPNQLPMASADLKESVKDLQVAVNLIANAKWVMESADLIRAHKVLTAVRQQQEAIASEIHFIKLAKKAC